MEAAGWLRYVFVRSRILKCFEFREEDPDPEIEIENSETDDSDMDVEEDDDDYEDIEAPETSSTKSKSKPKPRNKGGRPRKSFANSGKSQKRAKLQDPYSVLEKAAKEDDIDFPLLLGWLGKYHFNKSTTPLSDSDKEWLELFDLISSGINPISEHSVSVE